jgi:general secretion pathway protein A
MYTKFYDLSEKPFTLVPDPRYLFLSRSHREALAHLLYGIQEGEGFILVVGQVGTGKTTLCRTLLERVGDEVDIGFIFNPSSTDVELLAAINREFGIPSDAQVATELVEVLNRFLLQRRAIGRRVLLVIDEAQKLEPEVLEQIRLLSNLETEREKLLQILLFGQPELDELLARSDLRQLRQRITIRWALRPLTRAETGAYVSHRLRVAGSRDTPLFSPGALRVLYRKSGGVPRLINAVADRALLAGYSAGLERVTAAAVRNGARELPGASAFVLRRFVFPGSALVAGGLAVGLVATTWIAGRNLDAPPLAPVEAAPREAHAGEIPPPVPEGGLGGALQDRSRGATAARALDEVLAEWGYDPLGLGEIAPEQFPNALSDRTALLVLDTWSDLGQLQRLNLPAVLEVEPAPGIRRYIGLVKTQPDGMLVLRDGSQSFFLSRDELDEFWTGRALFLWTNFESVPALRAGMSGRAVEWLQHRLQELGYLSSGPASGQYGAKTGDAVRQLQAEYYLDPTGEVGPATLITIYQALRYGAPVLRLADLGAQLS